MPGFGSGRQVVPCWGCGQTSHKNPLSKGALRSKGQVALQPKHPGTEWHVLQRKDGRAAKPAFLGPVLTGLVHMHLRKINQTLGML